MSFRLDVCISSIPLEDFNRLKYSFYCVKESFTGRKWKGLEFITYIGKETMNCCWEFQETFDLCHQYNCIIIIHADEFMLSSRNVTLSETCQFSVQLLKKGGVFFIPKMMRNKKPWGDPSRTKFSLLLYVIKIMNIYLFLRISRSSQTWLTSNQED